MNSCNGCPRILLILSAMIGHLKKRSELQLFVMNWLVSDLKKDGNSLY